MVTAASILAAGGATCASAAGLDERGCLGTDDGKFRES
jgi:hypothetical protein